MVFYKKVLQVFIYKITFVRSTSGEVPDSLKSAKGQPCPCVTHAVAAKNYFRKLNIFNIWKQLLNFSYEKTKLHFRLMEIADLINLYKNFIIHL